MLFRHRTVQIFKWRQAVAKAAGEGDAGLGSLAKTLASQAADSGLPDTLDAVFGATGQGLGARLVAYVDSKQVQRGSCKAAEGETQYAVKQRFTMLLEHLRRKYTSGAVLIVSHYETLFDIVGRGLNNAEFVVLE